MRKIAFAATCLLASPAMAQHIHTVDCGHQWVDDQGAYNALAAPAANNAFNIQPANSGLTFILNDLGGVGVGTQARAGFEAAAAMWAAVLKDPITIRLDVRFAELGPNILGSTGSSTNTVAFSTVNAALTADAQSAADFSAVNSLQNGPLTFVTNEPLDAGAIDARTRFLDDNNTFDNNNINVNTAQLKALGLTPTYAASNPGGRDGSVSFSTLFNWDFDPTDGIGAGLIDFVGVAAHEIGHALGFRSGVDLADVNALPGIAPPGARGLNNIGWGTLNDLFRYGEFNGQQTLDWSIGGTPCFSIDAGASCAGLLSTGRLNGDGRQASHWKDDILLGITPPLGIMDPTATGPNGNRPFMNISGLDLLAFDVFGYDVAVFGAVPEPDTWLMMIFGFGAIGGAMRRRPRKLATA
ncbi:MAG: NF038122 family metalloprotease [Parasphingorhabdus sp.]|nr:NF038122 family metalloprotease [Parasphingorhabdus sp.]